MNCPDPFSVVPVKASGTQFFLCICASPDLCVVKNVEGRSLGLITLFHLPVTLLKIRWMGQIGLSVLKLLL